MSLGGSAPFTGYGQPDYGAQNPAAPAPTTQKLPPSDPQYWYEEFKRSNPNIAEDELIKISMDRARSFANAPAPTPAPAPPPNFTPAQAPAAGRGVDDWGGGASFDANLLPSDFNWQAYINAPQNKDLIAAGIDTPIEAQRHYALYGRTENRSLGAPAASTPVAPTTVEPTFRTADFQDRNGNGVDDRDEAPGTGVNQPAPPFAQPSVNQRVDRSLGFARRPQQPSFLNPFAGAYSMQQNPFGGMPPGFGFQPPVYSPFGGMSSYGGLGGFFPTGIPYGSFGQPSMNAYTRPMPRPMIQPAPNPSTGIMPSEPLPPPGMVQNPNYQPIPEGMYGTQGPERIRYMPAPQSPYSGFGAPYGGMPYGGMSGGLGGFFVY